MLIRRAFFFLRHGETDWNRRRVMQGHIDTSLSAYGTAQAEEISGCVGDLPVNTICCSPLLRARQTMKIAAARLRKPIHFIDDLKECGFGIYEGQASDGAWRSAWEQGAPIANGEAREDYIARVLRGLNAALAYPGPVLIVGHGGTFWAIDRYTGQKSQTRVANCALFSLEPPAPGLDKWDLTLLAAPTKASLAIGESRRE